MMADHSKLRTLSLYTEEDFNLFAVNNKRHHDVVLKSLLPIFDPAEQDSTVQTWLSKNRMISRFMGYKNSEMLPVMASKLRGAARDWYDGLNDADRAIWREKIVERFGMLNWMAPRYLDLLNKRKYQNGESLFMYFADKAVLIEALGMSGSMAVECIVAETGMLEVEVDVRNKGITNMDDLLIYFGELEFNRTFRKANLTDETYELTDEWLYRIDEDRYLYREWLYSEGQLAKERRQERAEPSGRDEKTNASGLQLGYHIPALISKKINTIQKKLSLGVEPAKRHEGRFFEAKLNGNLSMMAYLDNTCDCIALRRQEAVLLGLSYQPLPDDDRTWVCYYAQDDFNRYGPGCERPLGYGWYELKIDQVSVIVQVYIVRTEILHVPLIIGKPFLLDTKVTIIECGLYARICETTSLLSKNSGTTDGNIQVKIGPSDAYPKVNTTPLVQKPETGEEGENLKFRSVSFVMGSEEVLNNHKKLNLMGDELLDSIEYDFDTISTHEEIEEQEMMVVFESSSDVDSEDTDTDTDDRQRKLTDIINYFRRNCGDYNAEDKETEVDEVVVVQKKVDVQKIDKREDDLVPEDADFDTEEEEEEMEEEVEVQKKVEEEMEEEVEVQKKVEEDMKEEVEVQKKVEEEMEEKVDEQKINETEDDWDTTDEDTDIEEDTDTEEEEEEVVEVKEEVDEQKINETEDDSDTMDEDSDTEERMEKQEIDEGEEEELMEEKVKSEKEKDDHKHDEEKNELSQDWEFVKENDLEENVQLSCVIS